LGKYDDDGDSITPKSNNFMLQTQPVDLKRNAIYAQVVQGSKSEAYPKEKENKDYKLLQPK